jgi:hypothetical protein
MSGLSPLEFSIDRHPEATGETAGIAGHADHVIGSPNISDVMSTLRSDAVWPTMR